MEDNFTSEFIQDSAQIRIEGAKMQRRNKAVNKVGRSTVTLNNSSSYIKERYKQTLSSPNLLEMCYFYALFLEGGALNTEVEFPLRWQGSCIVLII